SDQDSGQDSYFDEGFRALLKGVYTSLEVDYPAILDIPIIQPQPLKPTSAISGQTTPMIDGISDEEEWATAAIYEGEEGAPLQAFVYGMDQENLYLRFDLPEPLSADAVINVYLNAPGDANKQMTGIAGGSPLVAPASRLIEIKSGKPFAELFLSDGSVWTLEEEQIGQLAADSNLIEFSVPKSVLGQVSAGSVVPVQVVFNKVELVQFNPSVPLGIQYFSFEPLTSLLLVEDPEGDDFGPGTYTYPSDGVFKAGDFDLTSFEISSDGANLFFTLGVKAEITNGWGSPAGFSVQTFDVYIDKDPGLATGARMLLPGRNAALAAQNGWEIALWIEGWTPQVVVLDADNLPVNNTEATSAMRVYVDNSKNAVVASVPVEFFGEGDPAEWAYAVVLLGQEGYPADGVWRVRDVSQRAEGYRFGGAPADNNHTRIIDLLLPEGAEMTQEEFLSAYPSSASPVDGKGPDDFAIVPMITAESVK
ncbi:MAG: hypothetical protein GX773_04770, partial [Chloroflexi bacterium]|nr:hypothetical protein [Chloroflexota bacterium]